MGGWGGGGGGGGRKGWKGQKGGLGGGGIRRPHASARSYQRKIAGTVSSPRPTTVARAQEHTGALDEGRAVCVMGLGRMTARK